MKAPTPEILKSIEQGALLVAAGQTLREASTAIGKGPEFLGNAKRSRPGYWATALQRAVSASPKPVPPRPRSPQRAPDNLLLAARLVASGKLLKQAAAEVGVPERAFYVMRTRHKTAWDVELAIARGELEKLGQELPAPTRPHVRAGIRQATAMVAAGLSQDEIAAALNVPATTIHSWRTDHRKLWDEELARAMETALVLVRSQAGTDKVEEDPATYICRARLCERWARENGRELFPAGEDPTLSSFYATYYLPVRLSDAAEPTKKLYRGTVRLWSLITGDPPLKTIGPELLSRFKNCLERMRGLKPIARMSVNTVRKHLCHLQVLLDKSGPPGFKNRDAAGIIPGPVPWIKPPRAQDKLPRFVPMQLIEDTYKAAVCMEVPRIEGIKPPAWWKALIVVAWSTQLRRRSLLSMRMEDIRWDDHLLDLPPRRLKSGRRHIVHLNAVALEHLRKIRTARELVFPWPFDQTWFSACFHRLQDVAAIPRKDHFGLHDLRKTAATLLWADSPQAAQLALGHASMNTTQRHYISATSIVARALDALPQPAAFAGGVS